MTALRLAKVFVHSILFCTRFTVIQLEQGGPAIKPIHFLSLEWLHTRGTIPLIVIFLLSIVSFLAAQVGTGTQETEAQRIYRQAYETAMANSPGSTWRCSRPL